MSVEEDCDSSCGGIDHKEESPSEIGEKRQTTRQVPTYEGTDREIFYTVIYKKVFTSAMIV